LGNSDIIVSPASAGLALTRKLVVHTGAIAILAGATLAPAPAAAFELFGLCLFGDCRSNDDDELIDPKRYDVTVEVLSDGQPDRDLEKAVRNASLVWLERKDPAAGSAGLLTRAKADYKRILAALYNEARYGAEISIAWNGREIADLPPGTELPDNIDLTITVHAERPSVSAGRRSSTRRRQPHAAATASPPPAEGF
jgi:translocation and assembly module TamA